MSDRCEQEYKEVLENLEKLKTIENEVELYQALCFISRICLSEHERILYISTICSPLAIVQRGIEDKEELEWIEVRIESILRLANVLSDACLAFRNNKNKEDAFNVFKKNMLEKFEKALNN